MPGDVSEWDFLQLLSFAKIELGISGAEFWKSTPAQFFTLIKVCNEKQERENYRFGVVRSIIGMTMGGEKTFDPWWGFKKVEEKPMFKTDTPEQARQNFQRLIMAQNARKKQGDK